MDLSDAVDEIYGAPLADFVATRTRWVTAAKDGGDDDLAREIKALRKPTVAAHLLNTVAREEPAVVAALTDLGERMRTAQSQGDGVALADLRPERRERIDALVAAAGRAAKERGVSYAPAAQEEVSATAVAVLADEGSGRALTSGRLLRPLSYAGFGEVELDDAVATPLRLVPPLPDTETVAEPDDEPQDDEAETVDPEQEAAEAARREAADAARDELREAERELAAARLAESEVRAQLVAARDRVNSAEARVADVTRALGRLGTRRDG
ncbi:hypothetical protein [Janibacter terrae]|uniref:hypothetical protein n=1 Tax=Janibacter terrae TaxID=103817 RepID=UPI000838C630|nr:hypothetical protein [Janibacter terrae]